ncbi:DNA methylase [Salinisphaera sp. S4-8]|uniref:site-specific DNA-methyltransferase n=1 Tax=Salinisphaera sp. S4-8 TaxID=633357 RepID=UPI003342A348
MPKKNTATSKSVETLTHEEARRKNIPTAEHQPLLDKETQAPLRVAYERRNRDLDPQLVWRGKDTQDASDLMVNAPPLYIQEKVHPKALIDELQKESREREHDDGELTPDLFADFNGLPKGADRTEFYKFDANWQNRMILGDSLQVMASLAEREGLRGQVQCIYLDPPYGIKFNSNFQWSTTSRDVKDGKAEHITREPEQVKAFRDTWKDGIHSYLTYLRERLTVARDLLHESGSIFVQIGDENVHRVRALMDEVFGEDNFCTMIIFRKTTTQSGDRLPGTNDFLLWYARSRSSMKFRSLFQPREGYDWVNYDFVLEPDGVRRKINKDEKRGRVSLLDGALVYRRSPLTSPDRNETTSGSFEYRETFYSPGGGHWKTSVSGLENLAKADRLEAYGKTLSYRRYVSDHPVFPVSDTWLDTATGGYADAKVYVVQTTAKIVQRCLLMATDPGDLVLDPTCGSGTTATVAEQWGRRWITIDTSRVALALARARIMGARYPYYLLADSSEGQQKEAEITRTAPSAAPTRGDIRQGFVYERVPHITLKSIANNAEISVIWERFQKKMEPLRKQLNSALGKDWEEWEIPREAGDDWPAEAKKAHADWWEQRIARQQEIDASIAAKADAEYLYDKPYEDRKKVRVAGPFTVESISPHRTLGVDEDGEPIDPADKIRENAADYEPQDFVSMILDNLRTAGVQQAHKDDAIQFTSVTPWPGDLVCAEGRYVEGEDDAANEKRAAIFVGPEFGTVDRQDLVEAAREAADADFDVLIACAFNFEAHTTEFEKLGRVPVLKARMNADLHMAEDLKNTGKGNLFVIFGEPDIEIHEGGSEALQNTIKDREHRLERLAAELAARKDKKKDENARPISEVRAEKERTESFIEFAPEIPTGKIVVEVKGVDVFHPNTGEVRSDGPEGIACWFIDTDYDSESFFVRHAYFLGQSDPYKSLKTTLKAEIDEEAWDTLHSATSRAFSRPDSGRIAVKVINHLGDEVMKVLRV